MSKIVSCDKEHFCDHQIGAFAERERIIKLLETHAHDIPTLGACYDMDRSDFILLPREDIDELIADIKGENK